jgi:hypothetical protein
MKTHPLIPVIAVALGLVPFLSTGCSRADKAAQAQAQDQAEAHPTPVQSAPGVPPAVPIIKPAQSIPIAVTSVTDQASASWAAIKDCTFDQRADFIAGAGNLQGMLASEVAELNAKRASMPSTVETKDWDFAMNEMKDSQAYLKSMIEEAARATPDTWNQEKDKVDAAWQRAQTAFDKVKVTTTS